jgi:hypothetical protein
MACSTLRQVDTEIPAAPWLIRSASRRSRTARPSPVQSAFRLMADIVDETADVSRAIRRPRGTTSREHKFTGTRSGGVTRPRGNEHSPFTDPTTTYKSR